MGDIRFRRLEQHGARRFGDRIELSLGLPSTPTGMQMRRCPRDECAPRLFQLGDITGDEQEWARDEKRIHREPHTDGTTCPYCGHDSADDHDFIDPRDIEELTNWFEWAAAEDVGDAVESIFKNMGRGFPRGGPISFVVKTRRHRRPEPRLWREDLLRDLTCAVCSRRYGVYAIALFCPDCGAPNLAVHFQRERELVEQQVVLAQQPANAELSFRLLGNAHEDVVTALETYLKTVYRYLAPIRLDEGQAHKLVSAKAVGNAFQNINRARQRFEPLEIDPFSALSEDDLSVLRLNIEKRHVLGHNLGLADEKYAEVASGEPPGQTVGLLAEEVTRFSELALLVVAALEEQAFPPPRPSGKRRKRQPKAG